MYSDIIFYSTPEGSIKIEVIYNEETFWLSQKAMAKLFGVEVNTINYHLKEIFKSGELQDDSVIRKIRITAADGKNYLNEKHIKELNRLVSAYLDLAENRAERQIMMKMEDWSRFLNQFLELSDYPVLEDKGKVSALEAKLKAEAEFEEYRKVQDREYVSDFDREVKRVMGEK